MANSEEGQRRLHEERLLIEENYQEWFERWGDHLEEWFEKNKLQSEEPGKEQTKKWGRILVDQPEERCEERDGLGHENLAKGFHSPHNDPSSSVNWKLCQ